ncbi:RidA family protein [Thalassotalea fonticola]|uniref:RidA family protein n=1 Tax=Thalassotalea fonticola TaxID=3065649 RepID=A0ABZ0GKF8_9GAMM|nr:RidA family protein [Colwelliaceae bacterium S1-1]
MKKLVGSDSHLEESIGFSRACRIGDYISVSGTAPISKGETVHIGDVYSQTKYCLELSILAVEEAGGNIQDVIRTRIMLTDISRWKEAAQAHGELFSAIKPACTFVEIKRFIDKQWLVETEVDCVVTPLKSTSTGE